MASSKVLVTDRARYGKVSRARLILKTAMKALDVEAKELSLLLTLDEEIKGLNKRFRGIDKATDVLSFPMDDRELLGDIAISMDKVSGQARDAGITEEMELARLCHHGLLHLLGYEHIHGGRQAAKMRRKEDELFEGLKAEGFFYKTGASQ